MLAAGRACPQRLLLSADAVHRRQSRHHHCAGEIFWSGAGRHHVPHPRRSHCAGKQHRVHGLAASIWSENINVALDAAAHHQGQVWCGSTRRICSTPPRALVATAKRFGRGGGRGLYSTSTPSPLPFANCGCHLSRLAPRPSTMGVGSAARPDRRHTAKLYIGGKQAWPDGGSSYTVFSATANRSSGRARQQPKGHPQRGGGRQPVAGRLHRAQPRAVLFFLAENMEARCEFPVQALRRGQSPAPWTRSRKRYHIMLFTRRTPRI